MFNERSWASSMMSVSYCSRNRITLRFGEQDAVGHQFDEGLAATVASVKRILNPTIAADGGTQFFRDAGGYRSGGQSTWLCVPDDAVDTRVPVPGTSLATASICPSRFRRRAREPADHEWLPQFCLWQP